jgi:hypothetical protein
MLKKALPEPDSDDNVGSESLVQRTVLMFRIKQSSAGRLTQGSMMWNKFDGSMWWNVYMQQN